MLDATFGLLAPIHGYAGLYNDLFCELKNANPPGSIPIGGTRTRCLSLRLETARDLWDRLFGCESNDIGG